jgi:hypothetical protein
MYYLSVIYVIFIVVMFIVIQDWIILFHKINGTVKAAHKVLMDCVRKAKLIKPNLYHKYKLRKPQLQELIL